MIHMLLCAYHRVTLFTSPEYNPAICYISNLVHKHGSTLATMLYCSGKDIQ